MKDIRRATRGHFSAEDKIRSVLEGLRGNDSIAELCRKEGIIVADGGSGARDRQKRLLYEQVQRNFLHQNLSAQSLKILSAATVLPPV